jgi:hypothetical protein
MQALLLLFLLLSHFKFQLDLPLVLVLGLPSHQLLIFYRRARIANPVFIIADLNNSGHAPPAPLRLRLLLFFIRLLCLGLLLGARRVAVGAFYVFGGVAKDLLDRARRGFLHVHLRLSFLLNLVRIDVFHRDDL